MQPAADEKGNERAQADCPGYREPDKQLRGQAGDLRQPVRNREEHIGERAVHGDLIGRAIKIGIETARADEFLNFEQRGAVGVAHIAKINQPENCSDCHAQGTYQQQGGDQCNQRRPGGPLAKTRPGCSRFTPHIATPHGYVPRMLGYETHFDSRLGGPAWCVSKLQTPLKRPLTLDRRELLGRSISIGELWGYMPFRHRQGHIEVINCCGEGEMGRNRG